MAQEESDAEIGVNAPVGTDDEELSAIELIQEVLQNFDCLPVLFIGAGLARRYIGAPDWDGALQAAAEHLGDSKPEYQYLLQKYENDRAKIGSHLGAEIFEWAWKDRREHFPPELFESSDKNVFLKHLLCEQLRELESNLGKLEGELQAEVAALSAIRPHAVITTNFDEMCEHILDGYDPIVGDSVLHYNLNAFGEIFHIHGISSDASSLVLTEADYDNWAYESKYFAAKLLTYFAEHPVFIFGYGIGDSNVRTVLADIGRLTADTNGLINNVIQIVYDEKAIEPKIGEFAIEASGLQYRLATIRTRSLLEIFEALVAQHELTNVNPALVRTLAARVMKLTRKDIPAGDIQVDYGTLERFAEDEDELPKLLGLTIIDTENKYHPYTLSMVADQLELGAWQHADKLLKRIKEEKGVDLKASDNRYHCRIKTGKSAKSATRKWSDEAVSLLRKVKDEQPYTLNL